MEIGLSLGSNLGNREDQLRNARRELLALTGARELARSPLYETDPVDVDEAFAHLKFVNSVLILEGDHSADTWMKLVSDVETKCGRVRNADRNAPRTVDIDIIYIDDQCIDSGGLTVPHPRWAGRRFVVQPLADVRPDFILPGQNLSVANVLQQLDTDENLVKLDQDW